MARKLKAQRFGEKLRTLRKQRHLTQQDLVSAFGYINNGYLSSVETGRKAPSLDLVMKVAQFFDISTDLLLDDARELEEG
jgi:transcriptional regulator with XRE-family HTH domain